MRFNPGCACCGETCDCGCVEVFPEEITITFSNVCASGSVGDSYDIFIPDGVPITLTRGFVGDCCNAGTCQWCATVAITDPSPVNFVVVVQCGAGGVHVFTSFLSSTCSASGLTSPYMPGFGDVGTPGSIAPDDCDPLLITIPAGSFEDDHPTNAACAAALTAVITS